MAASASFVCAYVPTPISMHGGVWECIGRRVWSVWELEGNLCYTSAAPSTSMFAPSSSASASTLMASFGHRFVWLRDARLRDEAENIEVEVEWRDILALSWEGMVGGSGRSDENNRAKRRGGRNIPPTSSFLLHSSTERISESQSTLLTNIIASGNDNFL